MAIVSSSASDTLLNGYRTAGSELKFLLNKQITETSTRNIKENSRMCEVPQSCQLKILDECSMVNRIIFNTLHRKIRDLGGDNLSSVVLIPVSIRSLPVEINVCLKSSVFG